MGWMLSRPIQAVGNYHILTLRAGYKSWRSYLREWPSRHSIDRHKEHPLGDLIGSRVMGWLTVRV
jgi:iron complex outermembrane recepter protein